jgi:predicted transcriptional regulator YdeE
MKWVATMMFIAALAVAQKDAPMNANVVEEPGFTVVGIETRTSNAREMTADGVIGKQWHRFMAENLAAQILSRVDQTVVAVYTDYASDHNGEYTYILGARVSSIKNLPTGMVAKKVPAGRYAIFVSEKGRVEQVVPGIWQKINSLPKSAPGGDRQYKADYETYDRRAANPQDAQVEVHVGIR